MTIEYDHIKIDKFLAPINDDEKSGEDMSFSIEFDDIKEARRFDDPSLSQGDWESDLKEADWKKVTEICTDILENKSKDIQVLGWLMESLAYQHGISGMIDGVQVMHQVSDTFWDDVYPKISDGDADERSSKFEWINGPLSDFLSGMKLVDYDGNRVINMRAVNDARDVDVKGKDNADLLKEFMESGKPDMAVIRGAVQDTDASFFEDKIEKLEKLSSVFTDFEKFCDKKLEKDAPNFKELKNTIKAVQKTVAKLASEIGVGKDNASENDAEENTDKTNNSRKKSNAKGKKSAGAAAAHGAPAGAMVLRTRLDAIKCLKEVSAFFQKTEPHSPVSLIVGKAVKWANMSLEQWLLEVVKDEGSLSSIQELLGIESSGQEEEY